MNLETFGVTRSEAVLNNGVRVVLFRKPNSPLYIRAVLKAGSAYDPKGKEGVSHLLEHMLSNGSKQFPTKDLLSEHIESIGGAYQLLTSSQLMGINIEIPLKEDIEVAIDLFDSFLVHPLLEESKFENEKQIILAELGRFQSNPNNILYEALIQNIFKNTGFDHSAGGYTDSVKNISYQDILNAKEKLIHTGQLFFFAAGDISLEELKISLNKLEIPKKGKNKAEVSLKNSSIPNEIRSTDHNFKQSFIFYGFEDASPYSKDSLCLTIAMSILTQPRSGKLDKLLRQEKGLIYSMNFKRYMTDSFSIVGITTDTIKEKTEELLSELKKSFQDLHIEENDVARTKNRMIKSLRRTMQTSESWVDFHFHREIFATENIKTIEQYIKALESITIEEIRASIKKYFDSKKTIIAIVN